MKLVNLTPHTITLIKNDGNLNIASSGIARVAQNTTLVNIVDGVEIKRASWGDIINLPEKEEGTLYIVSALVANAAKNIGRDDVVCPGEFVRDEAGNIVGAKCLMYP